jgi:DNA (cytosine-5)-methyltransferase 1
MRHRFPSRPNEPQHESEPSRLCGKIPNRSSRIKALGNAVVPQVAYPIFAMLYESLMERVASLEGHVQ